MREPRGGPGSLWRLGDPGAGGGESPPGVRWGCGRCLAAGVRAAWQGKAGTCWGWGRAQCQGGWGRRGVQCRGEGEEVRACSVGVARALVAVGEGTGRGYINVPGATAWRPRAIASSYQGTVSPTALLPKPQAGPDTAFPPGRGCELRGSPPPSAHRALHLSPPTDTRAGAVGGPRAQVPARS